MTLVKQIFKVKCFCHRKDVYNYCRCSLKIFTTVWFIRKHLLCASMLTNVLCDAKHLSFTVVKSLPIHIVKHFICILCDMWGVKSWSWKERCYHSQLEAWCMHACWIHLAHLLCRYPVRFMVTSHDCEFSLSQHSVNAFKFTCKGKISSYLRLVASATELNLRPIRKNFQQNL